MLFARPLGNQTSIEVRESILTTDVFSAIVEHKLKVNEAQQPIESVLDILDVLCRSQQELLGFTDVLNAIVVELLLRCCAIIKKLKAFAKSHLLSVELHAYDPRNRVPIECALQLRDGIEWNCLVHIIFYCHSV